MRHEEAEEAAARRNREDPRRDRFVFYALDESAGIAPDAWDVAMRLRRDDERPRRARPERSRGEGRPPRASIPPPASRAPATAVIEPEDGVSTYIPTALEGLEPTEVYDVAVEPAAPLGSAPKPPRRRFGLLRLWGAFVVLVGLAFIAAVLYVAFDLRDYTHLSTLTWGIGVAAGVVAVWVGVALARRRA